MSSHEGLIWGAKVFPATFAGKLGDPDAEPWEPLEGVWRYTHSDDPEMAV